MPLAVCVAPAANREQTQIASGLTTTLVFELCVSEMQPNNDENLPKLGRTPLKFESTEAGLSHKKGCHKVHNITPRDWGSDPASARFVSRKSGTLSASPTRRSSSSGSSTSVTKSSIVKHGTSRSVAIARLISATRACSGTTTEKVAPSKQQTAHETSAAAAGAGAASSLRFFGLTWLHASSSASASSSAR